MRFYRDLAYGAPEAMIFGQAVRPVTVGFGLRLGHGLVVPELKYSPRLGVGYDAESLERAYRRITVVVLEQALALGTRELMLELEQLPEATAEPALIARITADCKAILADYYETRGLRSALRITLADARPAEGLRRGSEAAELLYAVEAVAGAGADVISLESRGGEEVFAHAVARQDLAGAIFGVGVLGSLDMAWLWPRVVEICGEHGVAAGGDPASSTANTALFLASGDRDSGLSHCFAAAVRAASAVRSLVAFEAGASGPDKDSGYEAAVVKAIAGCPTSMQSQTHTGHEIDLLGRLPGVVCDLWSNDVVEYVGVGGGGTRVFTGILEQDVAQYNVAIEMGVARQLRDRIIATDKYLDPQSFVLAPDVAYRIASALVAAGDDYYLRSRAAVTAALLAMQRESQALALHNGECDALRRMLDQIEAMPTDRDGFAARLFRDYGSDGHRLWPESYGLVDLAC